MAERIGENGFDDDPKSGRNKSLSNHAQSFIGNWNNFPVNVLFTVLVTAAPVLVTLSGSSDFPVGNLTLSAAVSSLLTSATKFGGGITYFKAKGTMPFLCRTNILHS